MQGRGVHNEPAGAESEQIQPKPADPRLHRLLRNAQTRLLETGTRNRLIHVNREAKRANVVNVVNERSDDIFRLVVTERRTMGFLALGRDAKGDDEEETPSLAAVATDAEVGEARYSDRKLETRLGPDGLQKRLLKIARDATTSEQEQGVNILFLALGFLKWFEDESSSIAREAPLLLIPVALKRNARTSTYDLEFRDDEIVTNLSLQERLKSDFGILLPEIPDVTELVPSAYFQAVRDSMSGKTRWSVEDDAMQLGFYSFAKLLMHKDLDPTNWPEQGLLDQNLLGGLLVEGFETEPSPFPENANLDLLFAPADLVQVVDADSSQTRVIEEVRKGRNLVVQGPPGTGKSQTITNIIAAAVHDGKRVLFVAEKMAALSVVHKRLVETGLRDVCLELHSKNANKKTVLDEIGRTLGAGRSIPGMPAPPDKLKAVRDELNNLTGLLHKPVAETGDTPFGALAVQARLIGLGAPPPSTEIEGIGQLGRDQVERMVASAVRLGELRDEYGPPARHPFFGTGRTDLQPLELQRHQELLRKLAAATKALSVNLLKVATVLGVEAPGTLRTAETISKLLALAVGMPCAEEPALLARLVGRKRSDRLAEAVSVGRLWREERSLAEPMFSEVAWTADPSPMRGPLAAGRSSFFARLGGKYRAASQQLAGLLAGELPKLAVDRLAKVDALLAVRSKRKTLADVETSLSEELGAAWRGERTDFNAIGAAIEWSADVYSVGTQLNAAKFIHAAGQAEWLQKALQAIRSAEPVRDAIGRLQAEFQLDAAQAFGADVYDAALDAISAKFEAMTGAIDRYGQWVELHRCDDMMRKGGAPKLADRMAAGDFDRKSVEIEIRLCRAEAVWGRAIGERPKLAALSAGQRRLLAEDFRSLEKSRLGDTATTIRARHLQQLPQGAVGAMGIVRGELGKQRKHMPIRKLMDTAGDAVQRIKPVFLMSPLSVAQFLRPGGPRFDLLVIDEASQVRPEDALGAVARATQVVVVGDRKQLPPTSFFDRMTAGDEGDDSEEGEEEPLVGAKATELESILTLCEARGLPSRMLEWHYRSRDPSLIAVSNDEFYGARLVMPPSPLQDDPAYGLMLRRVSGVYDRGKKRNNRIEAEAVVRAVAEHARKTPQLSLGVATFSMAQRDLIGELLEHARRSDGTLDDFLREGQSEDFFVKNLENVQGDERDVIFVSVGYGPSMAGQSLGSMSFGPVNSEGGARRLNVLFTRAKLRCEVFVSFDPADISLERTKTDGVRILKRYLEFAQSGILDERRPTGEDADSPFEELVADEIRSLGYEVDHQVGSSGFRIDLGVRHADKPGKYLLAVECDGATYHRALWARERDRQRQQILEHLGWSFHRIWSTDWFYRKSDEVARLKTALEAARAASLEETPLKGANDRRPQTRETVPLEEPPLGVELPPIYQAPPYRKSTISVTASTEPHEVPVHKLAPVVLRIVEAEGPIHEEEVARRMASAFGKERAGRRIVDVTLQALRHAQMIQKDTLQQANGFWFTPSQVASPPIRDRSNETTTILKAEMLPPMEIAAAARRVLEDNESVSESELITSVARVLGFKRTGPEIRDAIHNVVRAMASSGAIVLDSGIFRAAVSKS